MNAHTPEKQLGAAPGHSDALTEGIRVRVAAQYSQEHSDPADGTWFYVYRVILSNEGTESARLASRHWVVIDANNERKEVRGSGVVGEHPELAPGERYEYSSGCPLRTRWGTMEGSFQMVREDGRKFDARIARFFLAPNVAPLTELE